MQDAETPVQGETQSAEALGTVATPPTVSDSTPATENPVTAPTEGQPADTTDSVDLAAQLELERRERQKAEMRANQLENAQKKQKEKELEEQGKYRELYEEVQNKLAEKEALEEQATARQEAENFRKQVIDEYPDEVTREAARKLIAKNSGNLAWSEGVESFDDAKTELLAQLDTIKEVVNPSGTAQVPSNNPHQPTPPPADRQQLIDDATRTGDWSKLIQEIPSVQAQRERLEQGL